MKIIAVYISLDCDHVEASIRSQYQILSNYISLLISDWLKQFKLDLGMFNRLIFEEGARDDLSIAGDRAFVISLNNEFTEIEYYRNAEVVHKYFVRKYIEGFERFDKHFNLGLTDQLRPYLEQHFINGFEYEKKAKSKKIGDVTVQAIHRYKYDTYDLVVRLVNKKKGVVKEDVVFTCDPDPFVVHYDVNKFEIDEKKLRVLNKVGEEVLVYEFTLI